MQCFDEVGSKAAPSGPPFPTPRISCFASDLPGIDGIIFVLCTEAVLSKAKIKSSVMFPSRKRLSPCCGTHGNFKLGLEFFGRAEKKIADGFLSVYFMGREC
jgi:hypothetical protein